MDSDKLQKIEARRARAQATAERSEAKLVQLIVAERLNSDPEHGTLLSEERKLRNRRHVLRVGLSKKLRKLNRLIRESADLLTILESARTDEVDVTEQLDAVHERLAEKARETTEQIASSFPLPSRPAT